MGKGAQFSSVCRVYGALVSTSAPAVHFLIDIGISCCQAQLLVYTRVTNTRATSIHMLLHRPV